MSDNEKLDDIFTYSSVGINDVKQDATGENVRHDIGAVTPGDVYPRFEQETDQDPLF